MKILVIVTLTPASHVADNVPTDIAAGPDQAPVQPKIKFQTTLIGNKHCSFNSVTNNVVGWSIQGREMQHTVILAISSLQSLVDTGKCLQKVGSVTGSTQ